MVFAYIHPRRGYSSTQIRRLELARIVINRAGNLPDLFIKLESTWQRLCEVNSADVRTDVRSSFAF